MKHSLCNQTSADRNVSVVLLWVTGDEVGNLLLVEQRESVDENKDEVLGGDSGLKFFKFCGKCVKFEELIQELVVDLELEAVEFHMF